MANVFERNSSGSEEEFNELSDLLYNNMPWEGESYQAVAEALALRIQAAGYTKRK